MTANFGCTWRDNTFSVDDSTGSFYSIYPSLNYELGPHTTARLQYEYSRNDGGSSSGFGAIGGGVGGALGGGFGGGFGGGGLGTGDEFTRDYTENAVTANLVFHL